MDTGSFLHSLFLFNSSDLSIFSEIGATGKLFAALKICKKYTRNLLAIYLFRH